ncbi:MAG: permease [Firmicutes bacterium]|nr:permease [Bacillota bacterium]
MYSLVLYLLAVIIAALSFRADEEKTIEAFKVSIRSLAKIVPTMLGTVGLVGLLLVLVPPHWISTYLGEKAGFVGTMAAAIIGAVTLIPGLVAFPLAGSIYAQGASTMTVAAFITTLTMVGFVTAPTEIEQLGKEMTIWRNSLSFVFALAIAVLMEVILP